MAQQRSAYDLEEIAPNRFLVNDARLSGLLKKEGRLEGHLFELTTWRREGLIARLRARAFRVSTLRDQIDALPMLPQPVPHGDAAWRALVSPNERYSSFDPSTLQWHPLAPEARDGAPVVVARLGSVLRRRKGRGGPASYYLAVPERGARLGLSRLDEMDALLMGYAQAGMQGTRVRAQQRGAAYLLPEVELPPPHAALLRRIATQTGAGLAVDEPGWPLAQELFARLGVQLTAGE